MTPIIPFIPLITAAVGVGTSLYTMKQADKAADKQERQAAEMMSAAKQQEEVIAAQQEQAAEEARLLAEENARLQAIEDAQTMADQEREVAIEDARRRASAAAGGVGGRSVEGYIAEEEEVGQEGLGRLATSAASRQKIIRESGARAELLGRTQAAQTRAGATGTRAAAQGTLAQAISTRAGATGGLGRAGSSLVSAIGSTDFSGLGGVTTSPMLPSASSNWPIYT